MKMSKGIKVLTGLILILYVQYCIYKCAMAAVPLDVIHFMICCIIIVTAGYTAVILYKYFSENDNPQSFWGIVRKEFVEEVLLIILITVICAAVYFV